MITYFEAKPTKTKKAFSPFDDNTFVFKTINTDNPKEMLHIMSKEFTLNVPITETEIRTYRRKENLIKYYPKSINHIIIDCDHVDTKENQYNILKFFKKYKCIIGESRSCNNIDNFNLKGILFIEPTTVSDLKHLAQQLHEELIDYCDFDLAVGRMATCNAPIGKIVIRLESNGKLYKLVYRNTKRNSDIVIKDLKDVDLTNVDTIEKLCLTVFKSIGFEPLEYNGKSIIFQHHSEVKSKGGFAWYKDSPYMMYHFNESRNVNIYSEVSKMPLAKELLKNNINYTDALTNFNTNTDVLHINQRFIELSSEIKSKIENFLEAKDGLFSIRSPMGTAKSKIIEEIIEQASNMDMRVLICSNRISVAKDYAIKYNIKLYNRDKYNINDSIIVQYDSLYKYNIRDFDLVIFDEFVSLLFHARNNISNSSLNIARFFACFNKKLIIADAFLCGYENCLLTNKKENVHMISNEYRDNTELYEYLDFNAFVHSIRIHAQKHKITISSTSISVIKALKKFLTKFNLKVITLTSETPQVSKDLIYNEFTKNECTKWDVLIFSPTLTVGVSNMNDIDYHFHYDVSVSCDVISSLQMIKRTRKTKEIHYYIKNKINYVKTSFESIKDEYIQNLGKMVELNHLFEMNDYGEPRLSKNGKKAVQIDLLRNLLEYNHKNAFKFLLKFQFSKEPNIVRDVYSTNVLAPYLKEVKQEREEELENALAEFLSLFDIEDNEEYHDGCIFDVFKEYMSKIKDDAPKEIIEFALRNEIKKRGFIETARRYKILKDYCTDKISLIDIQEQISNSLKGDLDGVKFWNDVINTLKDLEDKDILLPKITPKDFNSKIKIKNILTNVGYKMYNTEIHDLCERYYEPNRDIIKILEYLKVWCMENKEKKVKGTEYLITIKIDCNAEVNQKDIMNIINDASSDIMNLNGVYDIETYDIVKEDVVVDLLNSTIIKSNK